MFDSGACSEVPVAFNQLFFFFFSESGSNSFPFFAVSGP